MPDINVTSEALRRQLSELKQAADQVAAARQSIVQQYQQVSAQWNDTKSRDLGAVVNESNTALRNIEKVLLQGQKSLALILREVIEYESTNIANNQAAGFNVNGEGGRTPEFFGGSSSGDLYGLRLASEMPRPKVLKRDEAEAVAAGMRAIEAQMDAVRDDCADKGINDPNTVEAIIRRKREDAEIEFYNDYFGKADDQILTAFNRLSAFFSADTWASLNRIEREDALITLAKDVGTAYRIEIKGVKFYDASPQERGYYNGDGYLYINSDCLTDPQNRVDALDTIFHEGRHAFQHAAVDDPHRYGITTEQASIWDNNFRHYLRSDRFGYDRYYSQPVESDAFSFAGHIITMGGIR